MGTKTTEYRSQWVPKSSKPVHYVGKGQQSQIISPDGLTENATGLPNCEDKIQILLLPKASPTMAPDTQNRPKRSIFDIFTILEPQ